MVAGLQCAQGLGRGGVGCRGVEARETQVIGSAGLLQTLIREDLVDRYIVWIFPVVLGSGKRLFDGGAVPLGLRLASSRSFGSGVVVNDYVRDGDIRYGSFELE